MPFDESLLEEIEPEVSPFDTPASAARQAWAQALFGPQPVSEPLDAGQEERMRMFRAGQMAAAGPGAPVSVDPYQAFMEMTAREQAAGAPAARELAMTPYPFLGPPIPKIPPSAKKPAEMNVLDYALAGGAALINTASGILDFMRSPAGVALAALSAPASAAAGAAPTLGARIASRTAQAGMGAEMAAHIPEAYQSMRQAPTPQEAMESAIALGLDVAVPAFMAAKAPGQIAHELRLRRAAARATEMPPPQPLESILIYGPERAQPIGARIPELQGITSPHPPPRASAPPAVAQAPAAPAAPAQAPALEIPIEPASRIVAGVKTVGGEPAKPVRKRAAGPTGQPELPVELQKAVEKTAAEVRLVEEIPPDVEVPFARGGMATYGPNGEVIIHGPTFREWLNKNLRDKTPEQRQRAVEALIAEERNHYLTDQVIGREGAEAYWLNLTPVEQAAFRRMYFGKGHWRQAPEGYTPAMMGYEAINHALMRLNRMTPREIAEASGMEWLTVRSLSALEGILFRVRQALGTEASKLQREMLDRQLENIGILKETLAAREQGQQPQAYRKEELDAAMTMPLEGRAPTRIMWDIGARARTPEDVQMLRDFAREWSEKAQELKKQGRFNEVFDIVGRQPAEAYEFATGVTLSGIPKWQTFEKLVPGYRPPVPDPSYLKAKGEPLPEATAAAYRKKAKGEEPPWLLPPMPGEGKKPETAYERPSAVELGAAERQPASMSSAIADIQSFLSKETRPTFRRFLKEAEKKYGPESKPILEAAWKEQVLPILDAMSGEELARLRDRLYDATEGEVARKAKERQELGVVIADSFSRPLPKSQATKEAIKAIQDKLSEIRKEKAEASQRLIAPEGQFALSPPEESIYMEQLARESSARLSKNERRAVSKLVQELKAARIQEQRDMVIPERRRASILHKVYTKLMEDFGREPLSPDRKTITPDEIRWKRGEAAFEELEPDEPIATLGKRFSRDSRVRGEAESVTRRLAVVEDTLTGEVYVLSAYKPGLGKPMIVDPHKTGSRPNVPVETLFNQKTPAGRQRYVPVATFVVEEPVKNYKQRFESRADWESSFATEAKLEKSKHGEAAEHMRETAEEAIEPEVYAEPRVAIFDRPVTDREAGEVFNALVPEEVRSPADIRTSLEALLKEAESYRAMTPQARQASPEIAARARRVELVTGALAKMARHIERTTEAKGEQALARLLDWIYENTGPEGRATTRSEFIRESLARFAGEAEGAAGRMAARLEPQIPTARELTMLERLPPTVIRGEKLPFEPPAREVEFQVRAKEEMPSYVEWAKEMERLAAERQKRILRERRRYMEWLRAREPLSPSARGEPLPAEQPQAFVKPAAVSTLEAARNLVTGFTRWYSEWLTDRIRREGGKYSSAFASMANQMISRAHEIYGALTPLLDPARRESGRLNKATQWLNGLKSVTPRTAVANVVGAIEGTIPVPDYARKTVGLARAANLAIGKTYEDVVPGFKSTGKFERNLTPEGLDIVRAGRGKAWEDWTEGLAKANDMAVDEVRRFFGEWRELLIDPLPDMARIEKVRQDFSRKFPGVVTHVRVGNVGWVPLIHTRLSTYLEASAQRVAAVRSFREFYPLDKQGLAAFRDMAQKVKSELPYHAVEDFEALVKALHGHPTDSYAHFGALRPGSTIGEAFRVANQTVGQLMSRLVLTGQMFVQPGEVLAGATPAFLGYRNYLRGAARLNQLYPLLEQNGAVNRVMYDMSFDPSSPIRSLFRISSNAISKGFGEQLLNELQEALAAATARVVAERIQSKTLSAWEQRQLPLTLKAMGFTKGQVDLIMQAEPTLLAQFERKAASFLTSGNKAIAEGSRLGANRLFNSVFRFQVYPMMKMNQFRKVSGNWLEAMDKGTKAEKLFASEQLARFLFGTTLQGAITTAIVTLAYEGIMGEKIRVQEAIDKPIRFFLESFLATIGGPTYLLWRGAEYKGVLGLGEQAARLFFPWAIARNMLDMVYGKGVFRDMSVFERLGRWIRQSIPATRSISLVFSAVGLSSTDTKLEASIRALNRWKRSELGFDERETYRHEDERKKFRMAMRTAVQKLRSGDFDGYYRSVGEALGVPGIDLQSIQASLRQRKLLLDLDGKPLNLDQIESLANRIGQEAVDRLQYHDLMLEHAANGALLPPYRD